MSDDSHPTTPPHVSALVRHFVDLRDGTHGGQRPRAEKERLFLDTIELLDEPARRVLDELNDGLLLGTGAIGATGPIRSADGGIVAEWTLSWEEQRSAALQPITIRAHFGRSFHHPHLRGATVGEWPLNVFTADEAVDQLPLMRAIVTADLHNLVYLRDFSIVPATR
jgi:hypothetical protein